MRMSYARFIYLPGLMVLAMALPGCPFSFDSATGTFDDTRDFTAGDRLTLEHPNGEVHIQGGNTDQITIAADIEVRVYESPWWNLPDPEDFLDEVEIEVSETSEGITIKTLPDPFTFLPGVVITVDYDITLPTEAGATVYSGNGTIEIESIEGDVSVTLGNGTAVLSEVQGNVEALVGNGGAEFNDVTGEMSAAVGNGTVTIDHPAVLEEAEDITVDVSNGTVYVTLAETSGFEIDASVETGDIDRGDFNFNVDPWHLVGATADGTVNGGGALIDITVANGNIDFEAVVPTL